MNTKNLVVMALMLGIGAILHLVVPGIYLGMKPDFSLVMLFLGIMLFPEKKHVLVLSIATGIISGMTTSFPNGFFPNIFDKFVSGFVFFGLFLLLKKKTTPLVYTLLTACCTLISGIVFLSAATLLVGLPGPFIGLFVTVVLPTTVLNSITINIIYPIITAIIRRTNLIPLT